MKQNRLTSHDPLTQLVIHQGIQSWAELLLFVQQLPYGRNASRTDFSLVLLENKGTCSSKHAFLKKIADLNGLSNVRLLMGIYKMTEQNTPKIGNVLTTHQLAFLPEAHCYLTINEQRIDLTHTEADISHIEADLLEELEIEPEQVGTFKVHYHQAFLKKWLVETQLPMTFSQLWAIREQCIKNLS